MISPPRGRGREHLLDVAERILAERGLPALTTRTLTREAGVNVATVNYLFGTKDSLLIGLQERMLAPMTAERLARFDEIEAAGELRVHDLVRALIEPLDRMRQAHGIPAVELFRYLVLHPEENVRAASWQLLQPGLQRFEQLVVEALPGHARAPLVARISLVCQIAVPTALRALDVFDLGRDTSDLDSLVDLLTGGLQMPGGPVEQ